MKNLVSLFLIILSLIAFVACRKHTPLAHSNSTLRISIESDPQTLDPRKTRDLATVTVIHMLYEGLMRHDATNQPIPAMAEKVTISPDQKTYTFTLRQSSWSNGEAVTAYDFEQTWKSQLDPQFPSPNAYQLYPIKGAQAAKEGTSPIANVGVHAEDSRTLTVQLEKPTPYFLNLTATHFFYPIHTSLRQNESINEKDYITNGPYQLEKWKRNNELTAIPHPLYWDHPNVHLNRIALIVLDNPTALQLFQRGELDWTGSPLSTLSTDALASLKDQGILKVTPAAGVYLFRINTEKRPFTSAKMRQAFAMALNRQDLVEHVLQGNQIPALGIVPPSFIQSNTFFKDNDQEYASQLFNEALNEQLMTKEAFPKVTIQYSATERSHKIAQVAQQQWKKNFGIEIALESTEGKVFIEKLKKHDYQLGIGSWFADFFDPISFLEVFKRKENGTNNTQWESTKYISFLDESAMIAEQNERQQILKKAENIMMEEMPVIPLFYASYNYVKNPSLQGVYFSELGYLDFKNAAFE